MPYIIVHCEMYPGAPVPTAFSQSRTYIEFDGGQEIQAIMSSMGERPSSQSNSYCSGGSPCSVLNRLESEAGYKVVATNSVTDPRTGQHWQIWTLHKQA